MVVDLEGAKEADRALKSRPKKLSAGGKRWQSRDENKREK